MCAKGGHPSLASGTTRSGSQRRHEEYRQHPREDAGRDFGAASSGCIVFAAEPMEKRMPDWEPFARPRSFALTPSRMYAPKHFPPFDGCGSVFCACVHKMFATMVHWEHVEAGHQDLAKFLEPAQEQCWHRYGLVEEATRLWIPPGARNRDWQQRRSCVAVHYGARRPRGQLEALARLLCGPSGVKAERLGITRSGLDSSGYRPGPRFSARCRPVESRSSSLRGLRVRPGVHTCWVRRFCLGA